MNAIRKLRKAAKDHKCQYGDVIKAGEVYWETTIAPWTLISDDVDDEGKPIASRSNEWWRYREHQYCDAYWGDYIVEPVAAEE